MDISQFRHLVFGNFGENLCKVFSCKRLVFRERYFKNCCFFAFFVIFLQKFTKIIKNAHFLDRNFTTPKTRAKIGVEKSMGKIKIL